MRLFSFIFIVILLTSCGSKTYELSNTDFDWMPYKGKDTLVFTSTLGDTDTLFLRNGYTSMEYQVDPLSITPPDSTETFVVSYKYNFFDTAQQINNFAVAPLIILKRTKEKATNVGFSSLPYSTSFCGVRYFAIEHLNALQLATFQTPLRNYDDVFIFEQNLYCSKALKIYWSKKYGLIGYDKINSTYYTLTKKYGL